MNKNKTGIYKIYNKLNHKVYIGKTMRSTGFKERWSVHKTQLRGGYHCNKYLQNSWNKYGEDAFIFEIVEIVENEDIINKKEIYWIDFFNSYYDGYNLTLGGEGCSGRFHTEKTKMLISQKKQGFKYSEESKERMRANHPNFKGTENPFYGKQHNNATKQKISKFNKGRKITQSQLEKMRLHCKKGENKWNSILTNSQVSEIKIKLINGEKIKKLAYEYNVNKHVIAQIKTVDTWKNVSPELNVILKDMIRENFIGENAPSHRLSNEQVYNIKYELIYGETIKNLCDKYKVDKSTIGCIKRCETWIHIASELNDKLLYLSGSKNAISKYVVNEVRRLYSSGELTHVDLSKMFNLSRCTIDKIINYKGSFKVNENEECISMPKKRDKLSEEEIIEIKNRFINEKTTKTQLGKEYGVSATTIKRIINGESKYKK